MSGFALSLAWQSVLEYYWHRCVCVFVCECERVCIYLSYCTCASFVASPAVLLLYTEHGGKTGTQTLRRGDLGNGSTRPSVILPKCQRTVVGSACSV